MESALTACVVLVAAGAYFRALQHGFYALHIAYTAALCAIAQHYTGAAPFFSRHALVIALIAHLASINAVTYAAYAWDKRASKRKTWRIPERTLHALAFIGGSPAALFAQKYLRHKSAKTTFRQIFWLIALAQAGLVIGLLLFF